MNETPRIDEHSPTWRAVKAWAEQRLAQHRSLLEAPVLQQTDSDLVRGAIRDLKLLLELTQPRLQALRSELTSADYIE